MPRAFECIFSVANEESRYTLTGGLMLLKEDALIMVTTDGHRLSYIEDRLARGPQN